MGASGAPEAPVGVVRGGRSPPGEAASSPSRGPRRSGAAPDPSVYPAASPNVWCGWSPFYAP
eukprot:9846313-Alexandrium_andersonii.AAC.1